MKRQTASDCPFNKFGICICKMRKSKSIKIFPKCSEKDKFKCKYYQLYKNNGGQL